MMEKKSNQLIWREGVPVSSKFDDPYYSLDGGLAESRYVFYQGAHIQELFRNSDHVVIGETGFGTGLNFLATWQAWLSDNDKPRMTFISAEAYPLSVSDLKKAHSAFPELAEFSETLCAKWPPPSSGIHSISFENGTITLLLLFGDATDVFSKLSAKVDAWYLDGFAPAKNPNMWTDELFKQMARLSKPHATVATFTAAGFVRRGLIANGFSIQKTPGFGRKRERLVGKYKSPDSKQTQIPPSVPQWARYEPSNHKTVAIIGAGIGGLMVAHALKKRGVDVLLFKDPASGNTSEKLPAAILAPKFIMGASPEQRFYSMAFAFAAQHAAYIDEKHSVQGIRFVAKTLEDKARLKKIAALYQWPDNWMALDGEHIVLPKGHSLNPRAIIPKLSEDLRIETHPIQKIQHSNGGWQLLDPSNNLIIEADTVVLAAGLDSHNILKQSNLEGVYGKRHPELRANAGQMEIVANNSASLASQMAISFDGYLTAPLPSDDENSFRGIGSTYERLEAIPNAPPPSTMHKRQEILQNLYDNTGIRIKNTDVANSWTGLRATVFDHLPFAGPIPQWGDLIEVCQPLTLDAKNRLHRDVKLHAGLYMLAGLGSKGFQYAPILGEYIAAMITDDPLPLPTDLMARLHPARGIIRELVRSNKNL
ncbi:tRNA (5-methylaminomethyl-2-thiouridine)(34)-methyltransferase MnmD [Kordiimonas aquimaris]|uniref:tRNA (5-methylaminomethyl-2-thiouridine)(34)-methyltransferase MnmD n=1 Tax=Kordiimonas aquimaris TaxID=707591 RepID=UPI0021D06A19|nr:tRNA (5-methylaminomethyl-2-thiouridine)(34)-methyltransferase MnmD [Kordiimonas aquimaris]